MKYRLVLLTVLLFALAACGAGPHAVRSGLLRDTIFAVEEKQNGSYFLWMTHDDVGTYCTMDAALYYEAKKIFIDKTHAPEVLLTYISSNVGTDENPDVFHNPLGTQGCVHDAATVYVIKSIEAVNQYE